MGFTVARWSLPHRVSRGTKTVDPVDAKIIDEVSRAFEDKKPWSAHPQAKFNWLGKWIMREFNRSRKAAGSIIDRLIRSNRLVEVDHDRHNHRKGLCTPTQALEFERAKEAR